MRSKWLPITLAVILAVLIAIGLVVSRKMPSPEPSPVATEASPLPLASPGALISPSPGPSVLASPGVEVSPSPVALAKPDLTVDANGLSKATVVLQTSQGVIKFKFYPQDAPNTVNRIIELIQQGFYNGLSFHRVVPGFVIQGGDPKGDGTGGSGQKLKAEFNQRRHIEGTVAMARAADPDSADSQFYVSLGTHPHLDRSYTIFGQVIEGMDVAKRIKVGDKIVSVQIQ